MLLELHDIEVRYQKIAALKGVSMAVPAGGIVTIIGANGAGKTTTLRAISGLEPLTRGEIRFDGARIDGLAPEEIVRHGIAHVPEGRRVFPDLTVEENLRTGAFLRTDRTAVEQSLVEVFGHFPRLAERRRQWARSMSGGEQQMLAIGRALMSAPRVLLLDEPSMGLSPVMVQEIAQIVTVISGRGIPVVLVEQNAEMALLLAQYAYVLETGNVTLEGPAADLHENEHVRRAYLGG
ncbi:MAG: ABC transporter ATP-binding protein [Paracoccaceae bacterium]|nr:ABC transporter ATP-binding protein [Paracoccaceae bacterium]MDE2914541.1 ABC transporter ATP-binding protein [Paracoccaceae bacterium]